MLGGRRGVVGTALVVGALAAGACRSSPSVIATSASSATVSSTTTTAVAVTTPTDPGCPPHPSRPGQAVVAGEGMEAVVPAGWTVRFLPTQSNFDGHGSVRPATLVAGNFAVPDGTPAFGSGAVETMGPGNVFVSLMEYPQSANTPLFAYPRLPCPLDATKFLPNAMEHPVPGMGGVQASFTVAGRAVGLYAVLGSYADRDRLVPLINAYLAGVTIRPR